MEGVGEGYLLHKPYKYSLFVFPGLQEYGFNSRFALILFLLSNIKI